MTNKNLEKIYELAIDQHETLEDHLDNHLNPSPALKILRNQGELLIEMLEQELPNRGSN